MLSCDGLNRTFDLDRRNRGPWEIVLDYDGRMPESRWDRIASLFEEAQSLMGEERSHFLEVECGDEQELRAEVEGMLEAGESTGFLLTPVVTQDDGDGQLVGATIGGFRILRLLGEGGMGAVYEAEQAHPLRRVALKVLRSALASTEVRRRFEVEAELLDSNCRTSRWSTSRAHAT